MQKSLIYIASPYSHPEKDVRDARVRAAAAYAARLFNLNVPCYSPIAHWAPIADAFSLPHGIDAYWSQDEAVLQFARAVHVLELPGWQESVGVAREIDFAKANGIPVIHIEG